MFIRSLSDYAKLLLSAGFFSCVLLLPADHLPRTQTTSVSRQSGADNEYQIGAILWTQSSGEYRALAYQTFTLARLRLDQDLSRHKATRRNLHRTAVIVDVDETVLDNSRFQAELALRSLPYTNESWQASCERAEAGSVPGAVEFLQYTTHRGVHVFYITNRRQPEKAGTISNLRKLGFPEVSEETVMIREDGTTASKESRRQKIRSRYRIAMLIGDNLNDFSDDFSGKSIAERKAQVDLEHAEFGSRFIVVPNPMYGDWENAINGNKTRLTEEEKRANRTAALKGL